MDRVMDRVRDQGGVPGALDGSTPREAELERMLAERTALISRLQLSNDELASASAAKSDFLAAMSHELRTPLHAIIGFSELLLTAPEAGGVEGGAGADHGGDSKTREFASHIHGAGLHLLELINDVLDLARVEAGRLDLAFLPLDISALVYRTARTMRPVAARKQVALEIPEPAGIVIQADAARIRQIIFNLLSNAIKFTPVGGHVEVSVEAAGNDVRLTIADSGPGIALEDQERIFEPFEQSWRADPATHEGTGLGLALTRQLVEGHGGRIELDSALGRGSRFTVVLPRPSGSSEPISDEPTSWERSWSGIPVVTGHGRT
jgi:signal transduction histidine kinase